MSAVEEAYRRVESVSEEVDSLIQEVVTKYTSDLDKFVRRIEQYLDESDRIEDFELERICMRLPTLIYNMSDRLMQASLKSEVAKVAAERIEADLMLSGDGKTAADRRAGAVRSAEYERLAAIAAKHVYSKLKIKVDSARDLYEGVKKIITTRDTDKQVFRYTKEAKGGRI